MSPVHVPTRSRRNAALGLPAALACRRIEGLALSGREIRKRAADGAICPAEGKGAGIVMPRCNSEAMSMHLEEIAFHIAPGAHAILLLDQTGWHGSAELAVPDNITLMPLPPRCPELNPVHRLCGRRIEIAKSTTGTIDYCAYEWPAWGAFLPDRWVYAACSHPHSSCRISSNLRRSSLLGASQKVR